MRKLIVSTFVSLDGVMQAPGGPEEDPTSDFKYGGWMFGFSDEGMDISASGFDAKGRELLLGRKTYEIFEAYWPYQGEDNPIAEIFNATKKHVASRTLKKLEWNNSSVLQGDVASAVRDLKKSAGPDLQVIGSANLVQTLQAASLVDEFNLWIFPLLLGKGKKLFTDSAAASNLRLVRTQTAPCGAMMNTYVPDGDVRPGSFPPWKPSEKELERRRKMANKSW